MRLYETTRLYLNWHAAHDNELLSTLHEKAVEFVAQNSLNLIGLFDADAHAGRVHGRLDEAFLALVAANENRVQKQFLAQSRAVWSVVHYTATTRETGSYRTSTSGLLWRSTTCDGKLRRHRAESSECRIAVKYGASVLA